MADMKLDFDPLARAESIMAKIIATHGRTSVTAEERDQIHDLLTLSAAQSWKRIADVLDGTTMGINVAETIFNPNRS